MRFFLSVIFLTCSLFAHSSEHKTATEFELENRYFHEEGIFGNEDQSEISLRISPQYSFSWDNSRKVFEFIPYALMSDPDSKKTHFDIREMSFVGCSGKFEFRIGISKVYWGVAESVHLVNVINQTDLVESFDGEDKLGQPMIASTYRSSFGDFTLFILPYFRERTFPGTNGRMRTALVVDTDNPVYEDSDKDKRVDYAIRWGKAINAFDIGFSHFYGTNRDPRLIPNEGSFYLIPHYNIVNQTGLDLQATLESLLIKHEFVFRNYKSKSIDDFYTQVSGVEYSFYSVFEGQADVGILLEYISASEKNNSLNPFDNHFFIGSRLVMNDTQNTEFVGGVIADLDSETKIVSIEAKRRITTDISYSLELRQFIEADDSNITFLDKESYFQVGLLYFL